MMQETQELLARAMDLPPAERAKLIDALLESMTEPDPAIDAKWVIEAQSRLSAYRAGELGAVDADEVLTSLRV